MRTTGYSIILLFVINAVIYLNRNKGFDYTETLSIEQLYPPVCDKQCIDKWGETGKQYTDIELEKGLSFLKTESGFDTSNTAEGKLTSVAAYLFSNFHHQLGDPSALIRSLRPLQQLQLLKSDTSERLWCGNFQAAVGYFCTAIGLPNRYVEITSLPGTRNGGTHEVNEVYLENYKKWVMVDVTRNMLLTKNNTIPVSAAEYFNFNLQDKTGKLQVIRSDSNNSFIFDTINAERKQEDNFFNKNFFLRYYYMTDLKQVYRPISKLKRYLLPDPWYAVFDPQNSFSNLRFRVKQLFILLFGLSVILYIFLHIKHKPGHK